MCSWAFLGSQPYFDWRSTWEKQISENDSATIPNARALGRKNAEHEFFTKILSSGDSKTISCVFALHPSLFSYRLCGTRTLRSESKTD